eukprot:4809549-Alexandrium_andersonii.AAC.1
MRLIPSTAQLPPGVAAQVATDEASYVGPLTVTLAAGRKGVSLPAGTCVCDLVFPHLVSLEVTPFVARNQAAHLELPRDDAVRLLGPADLREGDWCALAPAPPEESAEPKSVPPIP